MDRSGPQRHSSHSSFVSRKRPMFRCDRCPFITIYRHSLTTHFRTHTGERPYTCDVCRAAFTQIGNYKRHMLKHTGEKPFKCSFCAYSATQKVTLQRHQKSTHCVN